MEFLRNSTPAQSLGEQKEEKSRSEENPVRAHLCVARWATRAAAFVRASVVPRCPLGNTETARSRCHRVAQRATRRARRKGLPSGRLKNRGGLVAQPYFRG